MMHLAMKVPSGADIRSARKSRGLTQSAVAEKADVSQAYLSRVENEDVDPRITTLHRVAAAINDSDAVKSEELLSVAVRELVCIHRKEAGLTQQELAERANVSQPLIARIEAETVDPRSSTLRTILTELDISSGTARSSKNTQADGTKSVGDGTSDDFTDSEILAKMASSFNGLD